ncbi:MAG: tetratricopeptide repeat protein [Candidatus Aminicenantes bacterium]|nr:tetratricopeptide repeat protein [Candidatus Aminicenantes bacterium]
MNKRTSFVVGTGLCLVLAAPIAAQFPSQTVESVRILNQNQAGVVTLTAYSAAKDVLGRGTGYAVNSEYIATNYHLVSMASSVEAVNNKGKKLKVEGIAAISREFDIALVRIKGELPILTIGNSDTLASGNRVFAIGGEADGVLQVREGTIRESVALGQSKNIFTLSLDMPESFQGGPVFALNEQIVGMLGILDRGLKFLIPINVVRQMSLQGRVIPFDEWTPEDYLQNLDGAYLAGRLAYLTQDTARAERFLTRTVTLNPQLIDAQTYLASVLAGNRDYQGAIQAYRRVLEQSPNNVQALAGLGQVYIRLQQFADAVPLLEQAARLNPSDKEAYYNLGLAYEQVKDFAKAADAYGKYIQSQPENPWTGYLQLGLCYIELAQYDMAIQALLRASETQPRDIKTNYTLAMAYQKANEQAKAEEIYNNLALLNPQEAATYFSMVVKMYDEAGNYAKAIEAARKVVDLNPKNEMSVYNLGIMYFKLERYDEAIQAFRDVLAIKPDSAEAWYQIGFSYSKQKKTRESIDAFRQYTTMRPDDVYGWLNVGVGFMLLKDFDSALEPLRKCVELKPDYGVALYNLAIVYLNLNDNFSARDVYNNLTRIDPELAEKLRKLLR